MKGRLLNFLTFCTILLLIGCSSSKTPKELSSIEALKSPATPKINVIRLEALKQAARGIAAQAALSWRSRQINVMLEAQKRNLDRIFNFNSLIIDKNVLPPVLVEGSNILNLADNFTIRVSDHEYQIIQTPRFITTLPNWRNYIWMAYKKPEAPNATLLPHSSDERKIWNENIRIGWDNGVSQANQIFSANLARLKRDYTGMILYRKLLAQNMVTQPYVSQADLGITGDANKLNINDRILRITSIPRFQTEAKKWHPAVTVKKEIKKPKPIIDSNITKGKIK